MVKRIILEFILIVITVLVVICGYFFIIDIESNVPQNANLDVNIETKEFMSRKVFIISPQSQEKSEKVILYFHGGAYMGEATEHHWKFLKKLVKDTNTTVIMPDYPLTPKYTYKDVLNMVEPLYKEVISKVDNNNLIMMGDSAGGGITLGLAEKLSNNKVKLPAKIVLISPWLDISVSNPKIEEVQPNDKELDKFKLSIAGEFYSRSIEDKEKYFVSPLEGNISKLNNIVIFTGTYDILNPDCYVLKEKAKDVGIEVEIKEYETASHIWIINNEDDLAKKAYQDLVEVVNQTRNQLTTNKEK